jgi:hypothetical protein
MLSRFFTKNVTRHLWQETTGSMAYLKRIDYLKNHLASSLTYLQECQERYMRLVTLSSSLLPLSLLLSWEERMEDGIDDRRNPFFLFSSYPTN